MSTGTPMLKKMKDFPFAFSAIRYLEREDCIGFSVLGIMKLAHFDAPVTLYRSELGQV